MKKGYVKIASKVCELFLLTGGKIVVSSRKKRERVFPPSPLVLGIFVRQRRGKRREERETKKKVRYGFGPMDLEG